MRLNPYSHDLLQIPALANNNSNTNRWRHIWEVLHISHDLLRRLHLLERLQALPENGYLHKIICPFFPFSDCPIEHSMWSPMLVNEWHVRVEVVFQIKCRRGGVGVGELNYCLFGRHFVRDFLKSDIGLAKIFYIQVWFWWWKFWSKTGDWSDRVGQIPIICYWGNLNADDYNIQQFNNALSDMLLQFCTVHIIATLRLVLVTRGLVIGISWRAERV